MADFIAIGVFETILSNPSFSLVKKQKTQGWNDKDKQQIGHWKMNSPGQ